MNILIIDDDEIFVKTSAYNLLSLGHTVTAASNGKEALAVIERNKNFDLIMCDVLMPELTGPSFLIMLEKIYHGKLPYIALVSGVKDGEEFVKKIHVEYDSFLKKPVEMKDLKKMVNDIRGKNK